MFKRLLIIFCVLAVTLGDDILEDASLSTIELLKKYGYPAETHRVTTSDGYILEMHRVPGSPSNPSPAGKPVVFVMHGMLSSSADYVLMGPNTALAYMLADRGFDVWMGNGRGNRYSNGHTTLDTNSREYWQFSWHELGIIDLPTMIDNVLQQTGQSKLFYIGHSQGTTAFWVMCAERPEYNAKIISMEALAPAAFMHNTKSPYIMWLSIYLESFTIGFEMMGTYAFEPTDQMNQAAAYQQCRDGSPYQAMCANTIFLMAGWNTQELNYTMLPVINGHSPAGASTNQMIHYGQVTRNWLFRQFDHGATLNLEKYGSIYPPFYNLALVTCPVALYHGANDWMATPMDVQLLASGLSNVHLQYLVPLVAFNHMDFVWAINQRTLVHERVIQHMLEML